MTQNANKQPRRPRLADLLGDKGRDELAQEWAETQAAPEMGVVPSGHYLLEAVLGNLQKNRNETPHYRVRFRIVTPEEHRGHLLFHSFYLTQDALPMSKRDLATLGIKKPEQLEQPLPPGLRVDVDVVVRVGNDGCKFNDLRNFKTAPPATTEPFAPDATEAGDVEIGDAEVGEVVAEAEPTPEVPVQEQEDQEKQVQQKEDEKENPPRTGGRKRRTTAPPAGALFVEDERPSPGPYQGDRR